MAQTFKGKPGDLIEIFRDEPYQHWAVYIGGQMVVHLVPEGGQSSGSSANPSSSSRAEVKLEKFADVVGSDRYQVNNLLDDKYKPCDPSIIVKEACERVGREPKYDLVDYNCEHFANEMRYGKAESRQVENNVWNAIFTFTLLIGGLVTGDSPVFRRVVVLAFFVYLALFLSRFSS
ncbi:phospholipase A and acyltransferase 3-like [Platichthys flesus]|uniref:phospholipase A and acyltransferase 3-like n=1 Tax=Platichthys flesus TaxID=8260 RepID=UPI002DB6BF3D|nr:phospholipase A and acyltransferase 3-like [Platichthys flesus]XP_062253445.1 phospholipase A and acyltransferase 3-like [Platichthys flesus]